MRLLSSAVLAAIAGWVLPSLVLGQSAGVQEKTCDKAPVTAAPTKPETGPKSGTAPGNSGSTGWTGGTGGSNIGTTAAGPTKGSEQNHPPTAQGLDPTK